MSTGKWRCEGVPHKGWQCVGMDDLEGDRAVCEMCEVMEIRYVHTMTHPEYAGDLHVGCICAEHMEQDYVGPRLREKSLRSRMKWLRRRWRRAEYANDLEYLNTDKFYITVYRYRNGEAWGGCIADNVTGRTVQARREYPSAEAAKLAAFDAMQALKERRV